jgi:hypothetical protein
MNLMNGETREARINRLKSQIDQGRYYADAITVAKAMLSYKQRIKSPTSLQAQGSLRARRASWRCPMYSYQANGQRKASSRIAYLRPKKSPC